ncbi:MAG: ATP-dependent helicase, partial [Bacteroidota bacterium]
MTDEHVFSPEEDDNNEHEEDSSRLLDNFLNKIAGVMNLDEKKEEDFKMFSSDDFDNPGISDELKEKIDRLQEITRSIEGKYGLPAPGGFDSKKFMIDYVNELNPSQFMAATLGEGPVLVLAGAGSGKTRVITHRVSYLLETGVNPEEILLLTFTRKAAREMLNRVEGLLRDESPRKVNGGTFHSFASYILRKYSNLLGISPSFTIIDAEDSADTIDLIRGEMKLHKKDRRFPKKGRLQEIISSSRNRQIPIEKVIEKEFSGLIDYVKDIEILAAGYQRYKKIANVLDYDDLMDELAEHLKKNQRFRTSLQKQYRYILVDEYQDTNLVQKEIVDLVAEKHHNVMVVGDDSQSIYGFRGANFENILLFPDTYPDCKVIKLEQNYRSNQGILDFANGIVENAKIGYKKKLFTEKKSTFIPEVRKFYSQYEEAEYIVDKIIELREKGIELNRVAVLYRAVWHGNYVQTELLKRNIPYVMVGGLKFTERKHIKDMISYLRLLLNPLDA